MATTEDSRTDREFRRFLQWAESKGGLDKQMRQSRGDVGAYDTGHPDAGIEYFSVNAEEREGAGLYDDQPGDYSAFPWAYREHPDYRKYWGRGNAYVGFIPERQPFIPPEPPEIRQSVLSTLGSDPLTEETNQSFVSRVSDASKVEDELNASTQSALQKIKKDPSLPFVGAVRQSFLEDEDEDVEPLSSPQANILRSFLEQAQQQRVQDSPAFQQRRQAIASILQTNPAFFSRQLQQVTSANVEQTEPKFTNILEEIETDPVEALQQTTTPTDFVRTFEEVDGGGFDEDGEDSFTSTTSLGDAFGGLFGEEDSEPAFGDFSSAQMSQAAQTVDQAETTFSNEQSGMPTPAEIAAAKAEGKNTLAMQAERGLSLFGTKASIFGDKMTTPQTLGTMLAQNIAEGFVMGSNPALAAPIAGGLLTPAGLIVAPVIAGVGAAADIANSTFSGFGFGNFASAFLNGLTFGLLGDSIEDQENEQAEKDLLVEDIFSNPFQTKDKDQDFGKLFDQTKSEEAIRSEIQLAKEIAKYEEIAREIRTYKEKQTYADPTGGGSGGISGPTAGMTVDEGTFGVFGLDTGDYEDGDSPSDGDGPGDGDGDGSGSACWVAGTQILMADSTYRNIEDLKIGDMVMSYPETKKTRRWNTPLEAKPIVSLLVDVHPEIWHLNDSMVSGTEWMIKGDGTAAIVQWLNVGDTVLGPDNNLVEITRVEPAEGQLKKQVIYNFETENNYTYIADGMRTIRGRAVRGEQWGKAYLSGDTNSYEGSMKDEYVRKFDTIKNAA